MTRRVDSNKTARESKKYQVNTQRHSVSIPRKQGKRLKAKQRERQATWEKEKVALRESTKKQLRYRPMATQQVLTNYFQPDPDSLSHPDDAASWGDAPIEPTGDKLIEKEEHITRFGSQNIMGLSLKEGHNILPETVSIHALQLDYVGLTEPNTVLTKKNKQRISREIDYFAGQSRLVCSSSPKADSGSEYSHGGTIFGVVGNQAGRVLNSHADKWGRFSWVTLQGTRDEGILLITMYRVPQHKGTSTTPGTAYAKQLREMIAEGDTTLDPRTRVLNDVKEIIVEKRREGFRPILLMDANDDWTREGSKTFQAFIKDMNLVDPLYEKYPDKLQRTYARGTKRLDYILVDKTIVPSIERIGTLGLHDGLKFSDHVFIYMDCNEKKLFNGIINRPMHHPAREFKLEQADRVEKFIKRFRELAEDRKLAEGVRKLAADFAKYGSDENMVKRYQAMDKQICQYMIAAAQFIKGRCGYVRSPTLTDASVQLHFWKSIRSCKLNKWCCNEHSHAGTRPEGKLQHADTCPRDMWRKDPFFPDPSVGQVVPCVGGKRKRYAGQRQGARYPSAAAIWLCDGCGMELSRPCQCAM